MEQDWQDKVAAATAEMSGLLGHQNAHARCAARFALAVTGPLNEWYADELARGTDGAVILQILPRCMGQMLGLVLHNFGGHPELARAVAALVVGEIEGTLQKARAGVFNDQMVRRPGARP